MTLGEGVVIDGSRSQTVSARWDGYTDITVDPGDDRTFWYVNEYYQAPMLEVNPYHRRDTIQRPAIHGLGNVLDHAAGLAPRHEGFFIHPGRRLPVGLTRSVVPIGLDRNDRRVYDSANNEVETSGLDLPGTRPVLGTCL